MKINRITIVTPSFNQGKYIEQTISSVLSQSGDFYLDYIIADGGSTDESITIIKKYANLIKNKKYPIGCKGINYRFWSHKDKGQTFALNKALKMGNGEICGWINSDDWYQPNALNTIVSYFQNTNADVIYGGCNFIKDEGKKQLLLKKYIPSLVFNRQKLLNNGNFIPNPSSFLKKTLLQRVGFINNSYQLGFDFDLWLKCASAQGIFLACQKVLSNCRIHQYTKTEKFKLHSFYEQKEIARKYGSRLFSPVNYLYWSQSLMQNCKILTPIINLSKSIYCFIYKDTFRLPDK